MGYPDSFLHTLYKKNARNKSYVPFFMPLVWHKVQGERCCTRYGYKSRKVSQIRFWGFLLSDLCVGHASSQ